MKTTSLFGLLCMLLSVTTALAAEPEIDPAKLKDTVVISPGQKFGVLFQQDGDSLAQPKILKDAGDKSALSFDFRKEPEMILLITKSPFPRTLQFRALARLKGRKKFFETSILPIPAKLSSYESWQDPIEELILFDFKLTDEKL